MASECLRGVVGCLVADMGKQTQALQHEEDKSEWHLLYRNTIKTGKGEAGPETKWGEPEALVDLILETPGWDF